MADTGPGGRFLDRNVPPADLSVPSEAYFGAHPDEAANAHTFGLVPRADRDQELVRVSYLFLLVFGCEDQRSVGSEYGGMQLRAETHLWAEDGQIPVRLQKLIQRAAHNAAYIFDSSVETPNYGQNEWASGYLSGFDPWENGEEYDNWEVEPVGRSEVHNPPGVIDWTTELYLECDGLEYADLSGVATGLANPWSATTSVEEGRPPQHVPSTKWVIGWEDSRRDGDGEYYVRPEPGTDASTRYREGAGKGKTVYVNEKPIGSLGPKGRVWLAPEYGRGDPRFSKGSWGRYWSREGLVRGEDGEDTAATWQALRKGGRLYQTGETRDAVYLSTSRAKPDGWKAADPDDVPISMEVDEGAPRREITLLRLDNPGDPMTIHAREDRKVIKHLGMSRPPYSHDITGLFRFPGFKPTKPYHVGGEDRDDGQAGLDGYGGQP